MLTPLGTAMPIKTTSGETVNYKLPQWHNTDITTWMNDLNYAMDTIDTVMYQNKLNRDSVIDQVEDSTQAVQEMQTQLTALQQSYNALDAEFKRVTGNINAILGQMDTRITNQNVAIVNLGNEYDALKAVQDTMLNDIGTLSSRQYYDFPIKQSDIIFTNAEWPAVTADTICDIQYFPATNMIVWAWEVGSYVKVNADTSYIDLNPASDTVQRIQALLGNYIYYSVPYRLHATTMESITVNGQVSWNATTKLPRLVLYSKNAPSVYMSQSWQCYAYGQNLNS